MVGGNSGEVKVEMGS